MVDNQRMISIIVEYIENIPQQTTAWPQGYFRKASFERSAANDILFMVNSHPDWTAFRSIEEFKSIMDEGMKKGTNYEEYTYMFEIGYRVANDISDILSAMV